MDSRNLEGFYKDVGEAIRILEASPAWKKYLEWEEHVWTVWVGEASTGNAADPGYGIMKAIRQGRVEALEQLAQKRKALANINRLTAVP